MAPRDGEVMSVIVIARSTCDEAIHSSFVWRYGLLRLGSQ
jgi:hypothetical protein